MVECEVSEKVKGLAVEKLDEPVNGPLEHVVALLKHRGCGIADLSLAGNPLGDGGGQTIARAVRQNTSLTHLDLRMAGLDNRAAAALGDALKYNKGLQSLNVSYNRYGDRGALALARGRRNQH